MLEPWATYINSTMPASPGKLSLISAFGDLLQTQLDIFPYELPEIFAEPTDEDENDPTPYLVAMEASYLSSSFSNGAIRTYVRPIGGGEFAELIPSRWELDDPLPRFSTGLLALPDWYDNTAMPTHRVFVSEDDFAQWMAKLPLNSELTDKEFEELGNPLPRYRRLIKNSQAKRSEIEEFGASPQTVKMQPARFYDDTFLTREEVEKLVGMKRSFIYDQMKLGQFPVGIKTGNRTRWLKSEITSWMNARVAERG